MWRHLGTGCRYRPRCVFSARLGAAPRGVLSCPSCTGRWTKPGPEQGAQGQVPQPALGGRACPAGPGRDKAVAAGHRCRPPWLLGETGPLALPPRSETCPSGSCSLEALLLSFCLSLSCQLVLPCVPLVTLAGRCSLSGTRLSCRREALCAAGPGMGLAPRVGADRGPPAETPHGRLAAQITAPRGSRSGTCSLEATPVSWSLGSALRAETPMGAACEPTARTLLPPRRVEGPSSGPGTLRSSASREATSEVNTLS